MANASSAVISTNLATHTQYNNLRLDAIGPYNAERVWNDNQHARFGTLGADGDIYSDGTDLFIDHPGGGNINLQVAGTTRLQITSTGFNLVGDQLFGDNEKATFGDGADAPIYWDGTKLVIGGAVVQAAGLSITESQISDLQTYLVNGGALGTPSSGVATNLTGTAAGLTAGNATLAAAVTTNANLTGHVTSSGNAAVLGSFTMAELDAAVSDGNILYDGDITIYTDAEAIAAVEGEATLALAGDVSIATLKALSTNTINETTVGSGVTVDSVLLKDGLVDGVDIAARDHAKYLDSEAVAAVEAAGLSTPALGTPSALVGTNITGTAAGLTAGNVTTNANLTGHVTSSGNAAVLGSFTKAQLSTAVSDGTPLYVGDVAATYTDAEAIAAVEGEATLTLASGATVGGSPVVVDSDIGGSVQAYDAGLLSIAGLTTLADRMIYTTASDTYAVATLTAAGRALIDDASASAQRTTLGLGALATLATVNNSQWSGTDLSVSNGGTGSSTASAARTALGVAIGSDVMAYDATMLVDADIGGSVQAYDALLTDFAALTIAAGDIIYGVGSDNVANLAAGTNGHVLTLAGGIPSWASPAAPGVHASSHENGGGDEISVTGLSGLLADDQHVIDAEVTAVIDADIGVALQAYDAGLTSIAGLTTAADRMIYTTASDVYAVATLTASGRALLDDASTSAQRTTLGLAIGTDVQAYSAVLAAFASGTDITVAQGGTGVSTLTDDGVLIGSGTGVIRATDAGTAGEVLTSGGAGVAPDWAAISAGATLLGKASDEVVNNSSTLQNDDDFSFEVTAGKTYAVTALLVVDSHSSRDVKFAFTFTGSLKGYYVNSNGFNNVEFTNSGTIHTGGVGVRRYLFLTVSLFCTGTGTMNFQWAQNSAGANDTTLHEESWMRYEEKP
jgi:hypothetical protein